MFLNASIIAFWYKINLSLEMITIRGIFRIKYNMQTITKWLFKDTLYSICTYKPIIKVVPIWKKNLTENLKETQEPIFKPILTKWLDNFQVKEFIWVREILE